jgi:hypothetical protein
MYLHEQLRTDDERWVYTLVLGEGQQIPSVTLRRGCVCVTHTAKMRNAYRILVTKSHDWPAAYMVTECTF